MTEEQKREYLKKNFVQPLSESLPMSSEYFNNSSLEQCISVNEDFANYIQFDLAALGDHKKKNGRHLNFSEMNEIVDIENMNTQPQFNFENIQLNSKSLIKNPHLKSDIKIEFNIEKYMDFSNECLIKTNDFEDSMNAFRRNYKKIVLKHHLDSFKSNLFNEDCYDLVNLQAQNYSQLYKDEEESQIENFRGVEGTPLATSQKSYKLMNDLLTTTSMKNVFENPVDFFIYSSDNKNDAIDLNLNYNNEVINLEFEDNLRMETVHIQQKKQEIQENIRMVNVEIQNSICNNFDKKNNFEFFGLDKLTKDLKLDNGIQNSSLKAKASLVFYNMMIATQIGEFNLKQNDMFEKLYLIKI